MAKPDVVVHLLKTAVVPTRVTTVGIPTYGKLANKSELRKRRERPPGSKNKKQKASMEIPTNPSVEINLPAISPSVVQANTNSLPEDGSEEDPQSYVEAKKSKNRKRWQEAVA
ncbi:hypothetical protein R1flu_006625 [Riccia fluitans]|uniref:Uncharacterized protein n=1 Tax=Riccia fluitans TaxID=41844 RepID=A0ABD1YWJ7_9MARC